MKTKVPCYVESCKADVEFDTAQASATDVGAGIVVYTHDANCPKCNKRQTLKAATVNGKLTGIESKALQDTGVWAEDRNAAADAAHKAAMVDVGVKAQVAKVSEAVKSQLTSLGLDKESAAAEAERIAERSHKLIARQKGDEAAEAVAKQQIADYEASAKASKAAEKATAATSQTA